MLAAGGSKVPHIVFAIAMVTSACLLWSQSKGGNVRGNASSSDALFKPTIINHTPAPGKAPGMVWIPGGEFSMGANDPPDMDQVGMKATKDARPVHRVYVDGFFMDKTDVTNAEFCQIRESDALYHGGGT